MTRLPDAATILRFRHLLEKHDLAVDVLRVPNDILQAKGLMMKKGIVVDARLIAAPREGLRHVAQSFLTLGT